MNANVAHLGNGREVHGETEYDPFGSYVYHVGNVRKENCHLEQALENLPADQKAKYKHMCVEAQAWATPSTPSWDKMIAAAACHEYLMECVKTYWAEVEERYEESAYEDDLEDSYCR